MPTKTATLRKPILLDVPRFEQPDDVTCGPTCLLQVYRYYGLDLRFDQIRAETRRNRDGGTLSVYLGLNALENGFKPVSYSFNLRIFDPSWRSLSRGALIEKLRERAALMKSRRRVRAINAYVEYLERGGRVRLGDLDKELLIGLLRKGSPILTGLSATYLYRCRREIEVEPRKSVYNDVAGEPVGHFVVVCGYDPRSDRFTIRDPSSDVPFSRTGRYSVPSERLIAAILLGDASYDAVLLTF